MPNKYIIFVPGKNPKPEPELHRNLLWQTLLEGIHRSAPQLVAEFSQNNEHFLLTDWNYLYYHKHKDISRDLIWIDALINKHGPTEQDLLEAKAWHRKLDRSLFHLADLFPFIIRLLPKTIRMIALETHRYFENVDDIACKIREKLKQQLRPLLADGNEILVIGHSLGSVISYDTLWELSHIEHLSAKVDLLTLGSPIGMNYVQHRLMGHEHNGSKRYPTNIRHWYNLSSVGDVTALDQVIHNDFEDMIKLGIIESIEDHCDGIYNFFRNDEGLNCHRSYGYLVNPAVGKIIADWWTMQ